MRYHVRCRKCRTRDVFPKHPEEYIRKRKCRHCKSTEIIVDHYRQTGKEEQAPSKKICRDSYCLPYPHRVNTKECLHYDEYQLSRAFGPNEPEATTDHDPNDPGF